MENHDEQSTTVKIIFLRKLILPTTRLTQKLPSSKNFNYGSELPEIINGVIPSAFRIRFASIVHKRMYRFGVKVIAIARRL